MRDGAAVCVDLDRAAASLEQIAAAPTCLRAAVAAELPDELLEGVTSSCRCGARDGEGAATDRFAAAARRLTGVELDDIVEEARASTRRSTTRFLGRCD